MTKFGRRQFLQLFYATSAAVGLDKILSATYEVRYTCTFKNGTGPADYLETRHEWENTDRIEAINKKYLGNGRLLAVKRKDKHDQLEWIYTFRSQGDYMLWNYEVYFSGLFNRSRLSDNFDVVVSTRYIKGDLT